MEYLLFLAKTLLQQADTKRAIPVGPHTCGRRTAAPHSARDAPRAPFTQSRGPLVRSNCSNSGNRARSFLSTRIPSPFISILSSLIPIPSLGFHSHRGDRRFRGDSCSSSRRRRRPPAANLTKVRSLSEIQRRPTICFRGSDHDHFRRLV
jgi:hypothetical protein